jgi:hypothetical protein
LILYDTTTDGAEDAIMGEGFRDREGTYLTAQMERCLVVEQRLQREGRAATDGYPERN